MKFDKSEFMNMILKERYWQFNGKYCPWERPVSLSPEEKKKMFGKRNLMNGHKML